MAPQQFRQLGVRPSQTTAILQGKLQATRRRLERLLAAPYRNATVLHSLDHIKQLVDDAYTTVPLQRLVAISTKLADLQQTVETGIFLGSRVNGTTSRELQVIKQDITTILQDLQTKKTLRTKQIRPEYNFDSESIQAFFSKAATRGWKVPAQEVAEVKKDGFVDSDKYLQEVSLPCTKLLESTEDFGLIVAPIILIHGYRIPESTLITWTEEPYRLKVHYVYGKYVTVNEVVLVGLRSEMLYMEEEEVDSAKFRPVAAHLLNQKPQLDLSAYYLVKAPKRVGQHHYCPFMPRTPGQQFFAEWDPLIRKDQHGYADDSFRQ